MSLEKREEKLKSELKVVEENEKALKEKKRKILNGLKEIEKEKEAVVREEQIKTNDKMAEVLSEFLGEISEDSIAEMKKILEEKFSRPTTVPSISFESENNYR